jgi:hypothetical protein
MGSQTPSCSRSHTRILRGRRVASLKPDTLRRPGTQHSPLAQPLWAERSLRRNIATVRVRRRSQRGDDLRRIRGRRWWRRWRWRRRRRGEGRYDSLGGRHEGLDARHDALGGGGGGPLTQRQDAGGGGRWWCVGRGGPHLCLCWPPYVVVQLVRPLAHEVQIGVCLNAVEPCGGVLQGGDGVGPPDQLVHPPGALGDLLLEQLALQAPVQPETLAVLVVAVAAVAVVAGAAGGVSVAVVVSHDGCWLCGWWEGEDVGVVVVVLRSGEIRASCVKTSRERKDAATSSWAMRPFSELQSSI